jgi:hypothetical protein
MLRVIYLNRDGCWLYALGIRALYVMFFPWLWLVLFIRARLSGRLWLVGIALFVLFIGVVSESYPRVAMNETRVVRTLRQLKSSAEGARAAMPKHGYPERMPEIEWDQRIRRFYRFLYIPEQAADGSTRSYVVQATVIRPECECGVRNFTLAEDGQIHYTVEHRPATVKDAPLE